MEEIRFLRYTTFDSLYIAWDEAFACYPRRWIRHKLEADPQHRGYDAALSFGAFHDGRLVAFTLNGIDLFNGLRTAYDAGTGTIPTCRGRGLAARIFEASVPHLQQADVRGRNSAS